MKRLFAALAALASGALSQNVVQFDVTKGVPGIRVGHMPPLARRGGFSEEISNIIAGGGYFVQVKVGTPPQNLTMLLDTGSSDTWVLGHDSDLCSVRDSHLSARRCVDTFDPSKSSTGKMIKPGGFNITYLDGNSAWGDYIADDLTIGGTTIKSLQMAYVTKAVRGTGILGLGFSASERASVKYPNIMDEMVRQGTIGCKAYSLYLNDRRADSGSILFGGIDTDKFIGPLSILPLHKPSEGNYSSFEIAFSSVSIDYTNGTQHTIPTSILDHPAPAVLDSGTTFSYLPDKMTSEIYSRLGAIYDPDLGTALIDCAYLNDNTDPPSVLTHLTFTFPPGPGPGPTTIRVPVHELLLDQLPPTYPPPSHFTSRACVFGLQSTALFAAAGTVKQPNFTLLGATFLRSAYVVYDLEHHQIGLAQANLNSSSSGASIVELSSAGTSLPRVTGVAAQQTTFTPTATARPFGPNGGGLGGDGSLFGGAGGGAGGEENAATAAGGTAGRIPVSGMVGVAAVTGLFALLGGAFVVV
jgi:hypothetical protein